MSGHDWSEAIGTVGIFALVTAVITVAIVQLAGVWRARAAIAREQEYRKLAEAAVQAQQQTERQLTEMAGHLGDMRTRMATLERVLKEVE